MKFEYHSVELLRQFVGQEVKFLDLSGRVRVGLLEGVHRPYLPKASYAYADTVLVYLPE